MPAFDAEIRLNAPNAIEVRLDILQRRIAALEAALYAETDHHQTSMRVLYVEHRRAKAEFDALSLDKLPR
jgi:hypothetical protein